MQQYSSLRTLTPDLVTLRDKIIPSPVLHTPPPPIYRAHSPKIRYSSSVNNTASFANDISFSRPKRKKAQIVNQSNKLPHIGRRRVYSQASQHEQASGEEPVLTEQVSQANAEMERVASELESSAKFSPEVIQKKKLSLWSPELRTPSRMVKRSMPRSEVKSVNQDRLVVSRQRLGTSLAKSVATNKKRKVSRRGNNFYDLTTQYQKNYVTLNSIYPHPSTRKSDYSLPVIPSRSELTLFLKSYHPHNIEFYLQSLLESNFCAVEYSPTRLYVGEMIGKDKSGSGILITQTSVFQGLWKNNQRVRGVCVDRQGTYKGTYLEDKPSGRGEYQWHGGELYVGEWSKGLQHGQGLWITPRGDSYSGHWNSGKAHGLGTLYIKKNGHRHGRKYRGSFVNFQQSGFGRQNFTNGDTFQGTFSKDKPNGRGTYQWRKGSVFRGDMMEGRRVGLGELRTTNNFLYRGEFREDKPEGLCSIRLPNGDVYEGKIHNGRKNGKGVLTLQNGEVFKGFWRDDTFMGENAPSSPH